MSKVTHSCTESEDDPRSVGDGSSRNRTPHIGKMTKTVSEMVICKSSTLLFYLNRSTEGKTKF